MHSLGPLLPTSGEGSRALDMTYVYPALGQIVSFSKKQAKAWTLYTCYQVYLARGGFVMVARFAVGHNLNHEDGDCSEQQNVNKAALVKNKLEDKPYGHK